MTPVVEITKALADESRLRILAALSCGELCVCQVVELMGLAPSTTSKHLSVLRSAGLIVSRKRGKWIHYRLAHRLAIQPEAASCCTDAPDSLDGAPADEDPSDPVASALSWVLDAVGSTEVARHDRARLEEILAEDPQIIAMRQRGLCCADGADTTATVHTADTTAAADATTTRANNRTNATATNNTTNSTETNDTTDAPIQPRRKDG